MSGILVLPQEEFEVGGHKYLITALGASEGLDLMAKLGSGDTDSKFIQGLVLRSISVDGKKQDAKWFNVHFARRYKDLNTLYEKIITFNLGEEEDEDGNPKGESGTSEE